MNRMNGTIRSRPLAAGAAIFVFLWVGLAARLPADTVVLKSGARYEGKVLWENAEEVGFECEQGKLTVPRALIKDVTRTPAAPGRAEPRAGRSDHQDRPAGSGAAGRAGGGDMLARLLGDIEAKSLEAWENEPAHKVTEAGREPFKYLDDKGMVLYVKEKPASSTGIVKVWARRACTSGLNTFAGCEEWGRLYWSEEAHEWVKSDPRQLAFRREDSKARLILQLVAGGNSPLATDIGIRAGQLESLGDAPGDAEQLYDELRRLTRQAAGDWGGGDLLFEAHRLTAEIARTRGPQPKIELAQRRREILGDLVHRYRVR